MGRKVNKAMQQPDPAEFVDITPGAEARPIYIVRLRALPDIDSVKALRAGLKTLLRRYGLRALSVKTEGKSSAAQIVFHMIPASSPAASEIAPFAQWKSRTPWSSPTPSPKTILTARHGCRTAMTFGPSSLVATVKRNGAVLQQLRASISPPTTRIHPLAASTESNANE